MRVTTRFAAVALWSLFFTALQSRAADSPHAQIVGYRCEVVRGADTSAGIPEATLMACQIGDDAEPFSAVRSPLSDSTPVPPTLDSLLNLLTLLDNARHEASLQRHGVSSQHPPPSPRGERTRSRHSAP